MCKEIRRILSVNGKWLMWTRKTPISWFEETGFVVIHSTSLTDSVGQPFIFYVLQKTESNALVGVSDDGNSIFDNTKK